MSSLQFGIKKPRLMSYKGIRFWKCANARNRSEKEQQNITMQFYYWKKVLHLRDPTAVIVLSKRKHISSAIWKFMTCFPAKLVTLPVCPGYWHDFGARQNLPSECLCLGQMVMRVIWVADIARIPALAIISPASVTSPHFDR